MLLLFGACATVPESADKNAVTQTVDEYRDRHLSNGRELEIAGDVAAAREMYAIAQTVDPACAEASEGVQRMEKACREEARQFYEEGVQLRKQGRYGQANQKFLAALRLWPEQEEALKAVTERIRLPSGGYIVHKVESGESLSHIAQRYYGDPRKFAVIAHHNKLADAAQLRLGQELKIPAPDQAIPLKQESQPSISIDQTVSSEPRDTVPAEDEQVNSLFEASWSGAEEIAAAAMDQARIYREQGIELFSEGKYEDSVAEFNKVLGVYPDDQVAVEYCYKAHFQIALKLFEGKDYLSARDRFYRSLDFKRDCRQCHAYIDKSENLYKEMHYRMGMQRYGREQLVEAIREWEMVRSVDPDYKKVGSLIKKAENILRKLEEIKQDTKTP